jgi:hypothetical protein
MAASNPKRLGEAEISPGLRAAAYASRVREARVVFTHIKLAQITVIFECQH